MAKTKPKQRVIRFTEEELAGTLDSEHARGYKMGLNVGMSWGQSLQKSVDDPLLRELQDLRARVKVLEVLLDGTGPAAAALARIVKGE